MNELWQHDVARRYTTYDPAWLGWGPRVHVGCTWDARANVAGEI